MAPVLTLLGTGTPAPLTHRAGSSYLLELAGEKLLIDCGPGSVRRLLETGVSPTEIAEDLLQVPLDGWCCRWRSKVMPQWCYGCLLVVVALISGCGDPVENAIEGLIAGGDQAEKARMELNLAKRAAIAR